MTDWGNYKPTDPMGKAQYVFTLLLTELVRSVNAHAGWDGEFKKEVIRHLNENLDHAKISQIVHDAYTRPIGTTGDTRTPAAESTLAVVPKDRKDKIPKGQ